MFQHVETELDRGAIVDRENQALHVWTNRFLYLWILPIDLDRQFHSVPLYFISIRKFYSYNTVPRFTVDVKTDR